MKYFLEVGKKRKGIANKFPHRNKDLAPQKDNNNSHCCDPKMLTV